MHRVLLVLRGPIKVDVLRDRCMRVENEGRAPYELAICQVLPAGHDSLGEGIRVQRELTVALRAVLGVEAENVPVFVVSEHDGYRVEDCAREWGATFVSL